MTIRLFKMAKLPKDFNQMPFGRQIEHYRTIEAFKATARTIHLSQKRQSYSKAIREAVRLYDVAEYFCSFSADSQCFDDSFQFWFTTK